MFEWSETTIDYLECLTPNFLEKFIEEVEVVTFLPSLKLASIL